MRHAAKPRPKSSTPRGFRLLSDEEAVLRALRREAGAHGYLPLDHALNITIATLSDKRLLDASCQRHRKRVDGERGKAVERAEAERFLLGLTDEVLGVDDRRPPIAVKPLEIEPLHKGSDPSRVVVFRDVPASGSLDDTAAEDIDREVSFIRAALRNAPPGRRLLALGAMGALCRLLLRNQVG